MVLCHPSSPGWGCCPASVALRTCPGSGASPKADPPQAELGGLCPVPRWHGDVPARPPCDAPGVASVTPLPPTQGKARATRRHAAGMSPPPPGVRPP